jgi:hypothetical protein
VVSFTLSDLHQTICFLLNPDDSGTSSGNYLTYLYYYDEESYTANVTIPTTVTPGIYTLRAVQANSNLTAFATLEVTSPQATVTLSESYPPILGKTIYIGGEGYKPYENVDIYVNDQPKITQQVGYSGSLSRSMTLPDTLTGNSLTIVTVGQESQRMAVLSAALQQNKPVLTLPETAVLGSAFTVSATGYGAYERIRLYMDGSEISSNYATASGTTSFTYTLPLSTSTGRHSIELLDAAGNRVGGSLVVTRANLTLTPSGNPVLGSELSLIASDFKASETVTFTMNGVTLGNKTADASGIAIYTIASWLKLKHLCLYSSGSSGTAVSAWSAYTQID